MKIIADIGALVGILLFYFFIIYLIAKHIGGILFHAALEIIVTVVLHFVLYGNGYIDWFILPLAWVLCILPSFYAYTVPRPIIGGKHFVFIVLLVLYILPPFVISALLAALYRFVLGR